MAPLQLIGLVVTLSLAVMIAAVGMDATLGELFSLFRHPRRLFKAVLAVNVVVPLAAAILVSLFPLPHEAKVGIIVMAVSPVPPFVPGNALKVGGEKAYSLGVYTALSLLSIVIVPVTVEILSGVYGLDVALPPLAVLRTVAISVVLPLALGLAVRRFWPAQAARLRPMLAKLAMVALAIVLIPLLVMIWPKTMALIGNGTVLAMALVSAIALFAGHLLGGPTRGDRGALAVAAATRHPGLALMIANAAGYKAAAAIIAFMLVGILVAIPYQIWLKRQAGRS